MKRIRFIGLALVAVFALGAVAAASASAKLFEAETYPATVKATSTNTHKFKVESGTVECKKATFSGSLGAASETVKVKPVYTECSFVPLGLGGETATVNMNGCEYNLHTNGEADVECATGVTVTVTAATCEVKVGKQTGLKTVEYKNVNEASWKTPPHPPFTEVEVNAKVKGITYTESTLCKNPGTKSTGEYEGNTLAKGFNEEAKQQGARVF